MTNYCHKINQCISTLLVIFAAVWFIFVILVNNRGQDPRVNALNLMSPLADSFQNGIYLRKIHLNEQFIDFHQAKYRPEPSFHPFRIFELIEIMNDESPNILGDEAILIVSISNEKLDLSPIKFAQFLNKHLATLQSESEEDQTQKQDSQKVKNQIPIYILRQTEPVFLSNEKNLVTYRSEIQETFHYFVEILDIKKLSVLSFEIGALLTLYSLAQIQPPNVSKVFEALNKVVLVNPFNLKTKVFHSPPLEFVKKEIKNQILACPEKFISFNKLRLLLISTTRTVFPQNPEAAKYFSFSFQDLEKRQKNNRVGLFKRMQLALSGQEQQSGELHRFNNTLTISSRAMWNVFCFFDSPIYFFYEPFINLLSKLFAQDSQSANGLSNSEIMYFLHYKELPEVKELHEKVRKKYIGRCVDFQLQNYAYEGNSFTEQCVRLLRRQYFYFGNSSIILYAREKFEVYGEEFQKLYPLESKTNFMVYHLENLNSFRRLFLINRKSAVIHLRIAPIFSPLQNPIVSLESPQTQKRELFQVSFQNLTNFQIIRTCQPANLIFPIHFVRMARFGHGIIFNKQQANSGLYQDCYGEYDNYDFYPDWFMLNWNILRNVMVFCFFCSHVLAFKPDIYRRFFTQNMLNVILSFLNTGNAFFFQNFVCLSTICISEVLLRLVLKATDYLLIPRKFLAKLLFVPICLEIGCYYYEDLPSSWKVLALLLGLTTTSRNFYIIAIKLSFLLEAIKFDGKNLKGILILCIWNFISTFQFKVGNDLKTQQKKQPKNRCYHNYTPFWNKNSTKSWFDIPCFHRDCLLNDSQFKQLVIDCLFLFSLGVCINEQGSVIDEIINAYIVINSIFYVNRRFIR